MKPTLNIIGAGKAGRVLGQQFFLHHVFAIQDIQNRTLSSSKSACEFIGAGKPLADMSGMRAADIYLIAVPDDQIKACSLQLQERNLIQPSSIVLHLSGALSSGELGLKHGAASLHPMRSFADPARVATQFANTICTLEGDAYATKVLTHALRQIGAQVVSVKKESKTLYHAAAVFASNYLVTILDAALQTFEAAGISREMARALAEPIAQESFNNVFRLGAQQALTGPIARGDLNTVTRHREELQQWDDGMAQLYDALATATQTMKARRRTH